jgi:hypothetical protein
MPSISFLLFALLACAHCYFVVGLDQKHVVREPKLGYNRPGIANKKYVEWSQTRTASKIVSFSPVEVPEGYYRERKATLKSISESRTIDQQRLERRSRRKRICEICDSAVITGRVIVKNEAMSGGASKYGLAKFIDVICTNLKEGFPQELPNIECQALNEHVSSYYISKYVHEVKSAGGVYKADKTRFRSKGVTKRVNIALASVLQNCKTLLGVDFCDDI